MWARLDDGYFRHRKNRPAGKDGRALDIAGICWANGQGTNGKVADTDLEIVAAEAGVKPTVARKLVEVGRWERITDGYLIHDFLDFNPSAEEVEEKRRKRAEAGRKGGQNSRPPGSKPEANASASAQAEAEPDAPADGQAPENPQSPVPEGLKSSVLPVDRDPFEVEADRRTAEAVAKGQVRNVDQFRSTVLANLHAEGWTPPTTDFVPGTGRLKAAPELPKDPAPIPEHLRRGKRHMRPVPVEGEAS